MESTKYRSIWDKWTWLILVITAVFCLIPCFLDDGIGPVIIGLIMLLFVIVTFLSTYYKIVGDQLIVYSFFIPTAYPISKIKEIKPTNSILSAPATALTHRLAITFTEKKILKSYLPLIISPVRQDEFLRQLLYINPEITLQ